MNKREKKSFYKALIKAEKLVDSKQVDQLIEKAEAKAIRHIGRFEEIRESIQTMLAMIRAWLRKEYKGVPKKTIIAIIAAIIYFLNPLDAIPDFLAGIGFLDDAAVFGFVINSLRNDLKKFSEWQKLKASTILK